MNYTIKDIDDYRNRLTEEQKVIVIKHCNKMNIKPNICAWYDDLDDFYSDWCDDIGMTEEEANNILNDKNTGEFIIFYDQQIIRFTK